jgi:aspartate-semialdehyde dehydrogenase
MKVAVVGVTGMVGQVMLRILEEREFPIDTFIPVASTRSVGKNVLFRKKEHRVVSIMEAIEAKPDFAIFSAGGSTSLEWAPAFAAIGTTVIDNSSAWRMEEGVPLVIPEINAHILTGEERIIANPNCSTIQMLMVLAPLHRRYNIKRIVVSTYQSVTGTGVKAATQLFNESKGVKGEMAYPHPIYNNCIPQCDLFAEDGYTKEEIKMVNETHKILESPEIRISATAVRVPVTGGHSESVNIEFENDFMIADIVEILNSFPGVVVVDNPANNSYPMPIDANGKDDVFVGRIRRDPSRDNSLNLWIVSDNLRKGAATNAIQIAEYLIKRSV